MKVSTFHVVVENKISLRVEVSITLTMGVYFIISTPFMLYNVGICMVSLTLCTPIGPTIYNIMCEHSVQWELHLYLQPLTLFSSFALLVACKVLIESIGNLQNQIA